MSSVHPSDRRNASSSDLKVYISVEGNGFVPPTVIAPSGETDTTKFKFPLHIGLNGNLEARENLRSVNIFAADNLCIRAERKRD